MAEPDWGISEPVQKPAAWHIAATRRRGLGVAVALIGAALLFLWGAPAAPAADSVYWTNYNGTTISFANLNGSGGGDLNTAAATVSTPAGIAIDPAAGRLYWANGELGNEISVANLSGGGGVDLNTGVATLDEPDGVAIDPAAGRIYWSNGGAIGGGIAISFANLNGSGGGGDLNTTGATPLTNPLGVALDLAGGRIFFSNFDTISFANLNGSGGDDLNTAGVTVSGPYGIAIDSAGGRVYWADIVDNKISFANLNGSGGGGILNTGAATLDSPIGVAIDPAAGRIYWVNNGPPGGISFANLGGGGGGNINTGAATVNQPAYLALLRTPSGTGVPVLTGKSAPKSRLSCSEGSWAPDLLGSFLYRAPQSFAYQWTRKGLDIAGATSDSIVAKSVGNYACRVTAQNHAGSTAQTSARRSVFRLGKVKLHKDKGTATIPVTVPGPGKVTLTGKGVVKQRPASGARGALARAVGKAGKVKLLVKAKGKRKRTLNRNGKVKVKVKVTVTPTGGTRGSQTKRIKLKKTLIGPG